MYILEYLKSLCKHKWLVFKSLWRTHLWLAITHDISKFLPSEFFPYAKWFYGKKIKQRWISRPEVGEIITNTTGEFCVTRVRMDNGGGYFVEFATMEERRKFKTAWLKHNHRNKHHPEWWILSHESCDWGVSNQGLRWFITYRGRRWLEVSGHTSGMAPRDERVALGMLSAQLNSMPKSVSMPKKYVDEMVADWQAANKLFGTMSLQRWIETVVLKIVFNEETLELLIDALERVGLKWPSANGK